MVTLMHVLLSCFLVFFTAPSIVPASTPEETGKTELFTKQWRFFLGDVPNGQNPEMVDSTWRMLNLPHDWSIEGRFGKDNPSTPGGGALPGGVAWYRKSFTLSIADTEKMVFVEFDGIYRNSETWINGHFLGKRPYGYSSFRYELTPYLYHGEQKNILAVRVDNSQQPNSRWYSGSGIYRNVWLVTAQNPYVSQWGTYVRTPNVDEDMATVVAQTSIRNASHKSKSAELRTEIIDDRGRVIASAASNCDVPEDSTCEVVQQFAIDHPKLWSVDSPTLYKALTKIKCNGRVTDQHETPFGIRTFAFDSVKGFSLNGQHIKIKGVCNHHDLGCLGAAINKRALQRQLEILKEMGAKSIRTSHNPPAPELLDLCNRMGFIVMDEAFDVWKKKKTTFDYSLDWDERHRRDLVAMILRDRNHPSVFIWGIGNEVIEQWDKQDSSGSVVARELSAIVKSLDPTRPITAACNDLCPENPVIKSGVLDLIGYNYGHDKFVDFPETFPGQRMIATETTSALATRGYYDMPSDSMRRWPPRWDLPLVHGNADNTCSSYDNCSTPWGSTHEETWKVVKKYDFVSGMYAWTGFDYLGEPTPYSWPSRSSYFGIIDLAGFPKDAYYLYQSEWTDMPVLQIFPHWNWHTEDTVDVWAYTNCENVELFLNGTSLGTKKRTGDNLHVIWRVPFETGTLKGVGYTGAGQILIQEIKTVETPAAIKLEADRNTIDADGTDLSFVTVRIEDQRGTLVPFANNLLHFTISGEGTIAGVDNGLQTSDEPFRASKRKAFNGICLVVIQSTGLAGRVTLRAMSEGLKDTTIVISSREPKSSD